MKHVMPVSYTHLDVYKRQGIHRPCLFCTRGPSFRPRSNRRNRLEPLRPLHRREGHYRYGRKNNISRRRCRPPRAAEALYQGRCRIAVSCTHLDVYKRQVIDLYRNGGGPNLEDHDKDKVKQIIGRPLAQTGVDSDLIPLLASILCSFAFIAVILFPSIVRKSSGTKR